MSRDDLTAFIEEYILENDGVIDENPVGASGMDSFGITMLYLEVGEKFGVFDDDYYKTVLYGSHTIEVLVDEVMEHANKEL